MDNGKALLDEHHKVIRRKEQLRDKATLLLDKKGLPQHPTQVESSQHNEDDLSGELSKLNLSNHPAEAGRSKLNSKYSTAGRLSQQSGNNVDFPSTINYTTQTKDTSSTCPDHYTHLDLLKSNAPMCRQKISAKLHELEYRLCIETKKYTNLCAVPDKTALKAECKQRLALLRQAICQYKDLSVGGTDGVMETEREPPLYERSAMTSFQPVTGTLHLDIKEAHLLAHDPTLRLPSSKIKVIVSVYADGKLKTQLSRDDHWLDTIRIQVNKRTEIELAVCDKTGQHPLPIGLLWIKMADIIEALRQEKRKLWQMERFNPTLQDTHGKPIDAVMPFGSSDSIFLTNGITDWFDLEPVGKLKLHFEFTRDVTRHGPFDKLRRAGAFREERKRSVHRVSGHKFVSRRYYQILRCAFCSDFMVSTVYQCQHCHLACHKQCYESVVACCTVNASHSSSSVLNHHIPHRFETLATITSGWCCHCGFMLPLGFHTVKKCTECHLACHTKCAPFVPDFCGITLEKAYQIHYELNIANERRRASLLEQHYAALSTPQDTMDPKCRQLPETPGISTACASRASTPRSLYTPFKPGPDNTNTKHQPTSYPLPFASTTPIQVHKSVDIDDFNFVSVLGSGNFGKVMLAECKYTGELYAIKVQKKKNLLQSQDNGGFRAEKYVFSLVNRDRHPFLLNLHSTFTTESRIFFVMEYMPGGDLLMQLQRQGLSEQKARFYSCEILLALGYLHEHGIMYRDLKLDNILLGADGHVKLADYGLCKCTSSKDTRTHTFCGTPEFMAPEMILDQPYTRAVDWWAFGILVYEMIVGEAPFKGDDEDELYNAIVRDKVLFPPGVSKGAISLCTELLTKDPAKRLGAGESDVAEVMAHAYYDCVQWSDLMTKRVTPPFVPHLKGRADTSNFDSEFTGEIPILTPVATPLTLQEQSVFDDFGYISDWALSGPSEHQAR